MIKTICQLPPAEKVAVLMYNLSAEETARWSVVSLDDNLGERGFALKADNGQILFLDIYLHVPTATSSIKPIFANFKQITIGSKRSLEK